MRETHTSPAEIHPVDPLPDPAASWRLAMLQAVGSCLVRVRLLTPRPGEGMVHVRVIESHGNWVRLCGRQIPRSGSGRELFPFLGEGFVQRCLAVLEMGRPGRMECRDAATGRWYQVDLVPLAQRELGIGVMDVTARHERETELLEGKLRYRALADGLPMPVWALTPDARVQYVNRFFDRFFGATAVARGIVWEELIHPDDYPAYMDGLLDALQYRRAFQVQVRGLRHDGVWRWLEMVATPRYTTHGRFLGLGCSMRDITDQRELEQAREQLLDAERAARTEAETNIRLRDEFLAMISHELRTPLTTVVGWSEMLLHRMDRNDRNYRGMSVIVSSTHALRQLINDMLDLGGMLVGKLQLSMQPLDMCSEVRDAVQALEAQAGEAGVTIQLSLPGVQCLVHGDRTRLQQVMGNLLSNALKFSDQAQERFIRVVLAVDGDRCLLHVQDNGIGISEEFKPHLFTRFRQADSTSTRRFGGLGLGLSIVHNIVEMHGGRVSAHSDGIGKGATFTVSLPLMERVSPAAGGEVCVEERALPQAVGTDSRALEGLRILLVDDQQPILDYLRQALERHGATVRGLSSPTEALQLLSRAGAEEWDLLISDIGMPVMDGYALARSIREKLCLGPERLPMIAVTALSRPADCERAVASGFQHVIPKPCNLAELMAAISRCCGRSKGVVAAQG